MVEYLKNHAILVLLTFIMAVFVTAKVLRPEVLPDGMLANFGGMYLILALFCLAGVYPLLHNKIRCDQARMRRTQQTSK